MDRAARFDTDLVLLSMLGSCGLVSLADISKLCKHVTESLQ
jgi:hypothetical protein